MKKSIVRQLSACMLGLALSVSALASEGNDVGVITMLYVDVNGSIAVQLNGGFPNATSTGQCPTSNGYAGSTVADPALKAFLMMAKATGQSVQIVTQGCDGGGSWWKITAAYAM